MNKIIALIPLLSLFAACDMPKEDTPTKGSLHVMVCQSQAKVMQSEADEFTRLYPEATVSVAVTSTRDAIVQLLNDSVSFICTDRPLNEEERAVATKAGLEITEIVIAKDALGLITHPSATLNGLTVESVRDIVSGKTTAWDALPGSNKRGPLLLALGGKNTGTYELLTRQFFDMKTDATPAFMSDSLEAVKAFVASHEQAFGVVTMAVLGDTGTPVQTLKMAITDSTGAPDTVELHQANVYLKQYPLSYPVYLYISGRGKGVEVGFSTFIASAPGQKVFLNAGLVPATMPVRLVQLHEEETQ